jgi:hypothetical protein
MNRGIRHGHRVAYGSPIRCKFRVQRGTHCWIWRGAINDKGYPLVRYQGRVERAHRVMWELVKGTWPGGLTLHHVCGCRRCVNPAHLQAVSIETHNHGRRWS